MDKYVKKAISLHKKGYNCCQAVVLAYADLLEDDYDTLFAITEAFGLGMGNMQSTCGAVSGMVMLTGLKNSARNIQNCNTKSSSYKISSSMTCLFKEKVGSLICAEIKGVGTGKMLMNCSDCVKLGAEIVGETLFLVPKPQK